MLTLPQNKIIYVYTEPVDMRKSINGLIAILVEMFTQNPQSGDFYLFTNRQRNKIKCLFWDRNGFALYYKRLEKGRFNYSKYMSEDKLVISETQLKALLVGLDFYLLGHLPEDHYNDFF